MSAGICLLTVYQIQQRIRSFDASYVDDWNSWLRVRRDCPLHQTAPEFGRILRRWQACRPNKMRRCRVEASHEAPFLEDIVERGENAAVALDAFDLRHANTMSHTIENALLDLWAIFEDLSYGSRSRNGLAGVVGISKAVLLLTEGRVGPAFDSTVRKRLGTGDISTAKSWTTNLKRVAEDITQFEELNQCTLKEAVPTEYRSLSYGRLYDMILGPGTPD